jgi:hypothetical protein
MALVKESISDISPLAKWHARFGHASAACIKMAVNGQLLGELSTCDVCLKGKITKSSFQGHFHPPPHPLKLYMATLLDQSPWLQMLNAAIF